MSWITFKEPHVLKARRSINVCKVVYDDNCSIYHHFLYRKANLQIGLENRTPKLNLYFHPMYCYTEARTGYHSFSTNFVLDSEGRVYPNNLMKMHEKLQNNMKIILCQIPVGSYYAKNEFDEYISESLIYLEDC